MEEAVAPDSESQTDQGSKSNKRSTHQASENRAANACTICRSKKVKCSGAQPCQYCAKRDFDCVFSETEVQRKKRALEDRAALYEAADHINSSVPRDSGSNTRYNVVSASTLIQPPNGHYAVPSPPAQRSPVTSPSSAWFSPDTTRTLRRNSRPENTGQTHRRDSVSAAASTMASTINLSSGDSFGTEVRTLVTTPPEGSSMINASTRRLNRNTLFTIPDFPNESEVDSILDTIHMHVGVSQQLFDVRLFSDYLSHVYKPPTSGSVESNSRLIQVLLVFAIGRLLEAKTAVSGQLPGLRLFDHAMARLPSLGELRQKGVLGIEILVLVAFFLQIADRKDDAYLYSSAALRMAVTLGLHRKNPTQRYRSSEGVHRNRFWWTIYMQERRLAANRGHPLAIYDSDISANMPDDFPGFPPITALSMNIRIARAMGEINHTVYSQNPKSEGSFLADVQNVLKTLHDLEVSMPHEYKMTFQESNILVAERNFDARSSVVLRTSSSLHLAIYQCIIYTVRPVLLHMARCARRGGEVTDCAHSATERTLAQICVEAARKSLLILQNLKCRSIIAKHAFQDLDCIVSVGFIFTLLEVIQPGISHGWQGIQRSCSILKYLADSGSHAAAQRLDELNQVRRHLTPPQRRTTNGSHTTSIDPLNSESLDDLALPFVFAQRDTNHIGPGVGDSEGGINSRRRSKSISHGQSTTITDGQLSVQMPAVDQVDISNFTLDQDSDLYDMYHIPGLMFTGVDNIDWDALELFPPSEP